MALRIASAKSLLSRAADRCGGRLVVYFSGGKDSIVVLDLAVELGIKVQPVFMYWVSGLECVERAVERVLRRYDVELYRVPHWSLSHALSNGHLCPPRNVRKISMFDIDVHLRNKFGIEWMATGTRSSDRFRNRAAFAENHGWDEKHLRVYPVWDWLTNDVTAYLRRRRIELPERLGMDGESGSSGFTLRPEVLNYIARKHPEDFRRLLQVFPYADAHIAKERLYSGTD